MGKNERLTLKQKKVVHMREIYSLGITFFLIATIHSDHTLFLFIFFFNKL